MSVIPYILYLYLLGFHVTILSDLTSIFGVTIDLAALMVCLIAIYKSELTALWFAIAAAVIVGTWAGAPNLANIPWEMLFLGGLALAVRHLSVRLNLDSTASKLLLLAGGLLFHRLALTLVISQADFFTLLYRYIIPSVLYTWCLGWLYFLYHDGRITWAKFKALF